MMRVKSAFSLVEVMVVIVIVGILVAIAIPNYTRTREQAIDREGLSILRLLVSASRQYMLENPGVRLTNLNNWNDVNQQLHTEINTPNWSISRLRVNSNTISVNLTRQGGGNNWGRTISMRRDANGNITYNCTPAQNAQCPCGKGNICGE